MTLNSTAKISDIITALQNMQGINQKADLKSALVSKGVSALDSDTMADLINKVNNFSNIKSIQRISSEWTPNASTVTKSISQVDLNKSIILVSNIAGNSAPVYTEVMVRFINNTTIELSIGGSVNSTAPIMEITIIEFNNVKSLQSATVSVSTGTIGTYDTFNITSIDPNKSLIVGSHKNTYTSVVSTETHHIYKFNSSTQIAISRGSYGTTTASYFVVEFI